MDGNDNNNGVADQGGNSTNATASGNIDDAGNGTTALAIRTLPATLHRHPLLPL
jgi:hypothetical protein